MEKQNDMPKSQIRECKPRGLYVHESLQSDMAYEALFNYPAPNAYKTSSLIGSSPMFIDSVIQPLINAPLIYELAFLDRSLRSLKTPALKRENIMELKFPVSTPTPIYLLGMMVFEYKHPVPVSVDSSDLLKLENFLRDEHILTTGKISGALSLAIDLEGPENIGKYKGIIALGVNDTGNDKPIGMIFVPEEMVRFSIEKSGSFKSRKEKQTISEVLPVLN